jgi:hypothetical protein
MIRPGPALVGAGWPRAEKAVAHRTATPASTQHRRATRNPLIGVFLLPVRE